MIRYLSLSEVLDLHDRIIAETGGSFGLRDIKALESALAQPRQSFGGEDLYPDLAAKAAALGFSLIKNHPFVDGNNRVGHAALEAGRAASDSSEIFLRLIAMAAGPRKATLRLDDARAREST